MLLSLPTVSVRPLPLAFSWYPPVAEAEAVWAAAPSRPQGAASRSRGSGSGSGTRNGGGGTGAGSSSGARDEGGSGTGGGSAAAAGQRVETAPQPPAREQQAALQPPSPVRPATAPSIPGWLRSIGNRLQAGAGAAETQLPAPAAQAAPAPVALPPAAAATAGAPAGGRLSYAAQLQTGAPRPRSPPMPRLTSAALASRIAARSARHAVPSWQPTRRLRQASVLDARRHRGWFPPADEFLSSGSLSMMIALAGSVARVLRECSKMKKRSVSSEMIVDI